MPLVDLRQDVLVHSAAGEGSKLDEEFDPVCGAHDVDDLGRFWSRVAVGVRRTTRDEHVVAGAGGDQFVSQAHPVLAGNNREGLLVPGVDIVTNAGLPGRVVAFHDRVAGVAFWLIKELQSAAPRGPKLHAAGGRVPHDNRIPRHVNAHPADYALALDDRVGPGRSKPEAANPYPTKSGERSRP